MRSRLWRRKEQGVGWVTPYISVPSGPSVICGKFGAQERGLDDRYSFSLVKITLILKENNFPLKHPHLLPKTAGIKTQLFHNFPNLCKYLIFFSQIAKRMWFLLLFNWLLLQTWLFVRRFSANCPEEMIIPYLSKVTMFGGGISTGIIQRTYPLIL